MRKMRKMEEEVDVSFVVCILPFCFMLAASFLFDCGTLSPANEKKKLEAEIKELRAEIEKLKSPPEAVE